MYGVRERNRSRYLPLRLRLAIQYVLGHYYGRLPVKREKDPFHHHNYDSYHIPKAQIGADSTLARSRETLIQNPSIVKAAHNSTAIAGYLRYYEILHTIHLLPSLSNEPN